MHTNVVCFTSHRLAHTANRITGLSKEMVVRRIDHLHNLRLQYDKRKRVSGIPSRSYYLYAPECRGGLARRSIAPVTINRLIDMLREEAIPATVLDFPHEL